MLLKSLIVDLTSLFKSNIMNVHPPGGGVRSGWELVFYSFKI
jgi:hypothetical protein